MRLAARKTSPDLAPAASQPLVDRSPSVEQASLMDYTDLITIEPGKRSGQPCIRGMRITVYDVLSYLASGMSTAEILDDFPYLTADDIQACQAFAEISPA